MSIDRLKVILEAQPVCIPQPRGIAYYSVQVIRRLLERNVNDYALTFFDGNKEMNNRRWIDKYFGGFGVPVHECNAISYRETFTNRELYSEKSYNDYTGADGDVFHFLNIVSVPGRLDGKAVVTVHDLSHIKYPEYHAPRAVEMVRFNLEYLRKLNPTIITVSESAKKDILEYMNISEQSIFIIPESYDEQFVPLGGGLENDTGVLQKMGIDKPFLLFLSAIAKNKNLSRVVEAFEIFSRKYPDIELVVAGGEAKLPDTDGLSKIDANRIKTRIKKIGYVDDMQKHALYSNALVFLFPSLFEGFGLPVLEAMARGCPVITSNVSSLPEVAGDAAILVDPFDTEQLAFEMQRVVSSETLRDELKAKGLARCKQFSWDKTAEMTETVYQAARH